MTTTFLTTTFNRVATTLGLALLTATFAPFATAGCGDVPGSSHAPHQGYLMQAAYRPAQLVRVSDRDRDPHGASIVGLWRFTQTAEGNGSEGPPDDTPIDWGYAEWHSDGTEMMNSGSRAPATENFCMGVWEKTGPATYKLNHVALSYDQYSGVLNATVSIKELVTVDKTGNSFTGTFSIDITDPEGNPGPHIVGTMTGTRITADQ